MQRLSARAVRKRAGYCLWLLLIAAAVLHLWLAVTAGDALDGFIIVLIGGPLLLRGADAMDRDQYGLALMACLALFVAWLLGLGWLY